MAWKLKGRYVASCSCSMVCPCATASAPPDNPDGTTNCWTFAVFNVREGAMDGVDLSGIRFGLEVNFPDLVTSGNWKIGVVVDEGTSDEQVKALSEILSGHPWAAARDHAAVCDGEITLHCQEGPVSFQWQAWWSTYGLFVLLRRKPLLGLVGKLVRG